MILSINLVIGLILILKKDIILVLTKQEFLQLREVILNIDNDSVKEEFNNIVTNKNPHIEAATTTETLSLSVSNELSNEIGKVFIDHSKTLGKHLNVSIAGIPKLISQGKKLLADLGKAIKKTTKK